MKLLIGAGRILHIILRLVSYIYFNTKLFLPIIIDIVFVINIILNFLFFFSEIKPKFKIQFTRRRRTFRTEIITILSVKHAYNIVEFVL